MSIRVWGQFPFKKIVGQECKGQEVELDLIPMPSSPLLINACSSSGYAAALRV